MMMKKYLLFMILLTVNCLYAQQTSVGVREGGASATNLFEYGKAVKNSSDNFENLFRNFPLFLQKTATVEFLSYEYVGVVKREKQAKVLLGKNLASKMPRWNVTTVSSSVPEKIEVSLNEASVVAKQALENKIQELLVKEIGIGYEIYKIRFVYHLKPYNYYIFVNPQNNRVVLEGNLFGFALPIEASL